MSITEVLSSIIEAVGVKRHTRPKRNYKIVGSHCPKCGTDKALKRWTVWRCVRCDNREFHRQPDGFCVKCLKPNLMAPFGGYECSWCHWTT